MMHDLNSIQLDDEDSSKYFINYLSDDSDGMDNGNDMEATQSNDDEFDTSSLPNCLIITPVPQDLFSNQELKVSRAHRSRIVTLILATRSGRIRAIVSRLRSGNRGALPEILPTRSNYLYITLHRASGSITSARVFLSRQSTQDLLRLRKCDVCRARVQ